MNSEEFALVFDHQITLCRSMLLNKAEEYATDDDRLHNFQVAAELSGTDMVKALGGMMIKHTVSVYDMIREFDPREDIGMDRWDEKINDHVNYLILLRAVLVDYVQKQTEKSAVNLSLGKPEINFGPATKTVNSFRKTKTLTEEDVNEMKDKFR